MNEFVGIIITGLASWVVIALIFAGLFGIFMAWQKKRHNEEFKKYKEYSKINKNEYESV